MNKLLNKQHVRFLMFFLFYSIVFFYTVSFNKEAGWVLFFFLTFLSLIDILSFLPSTNKIQSEAIEQSRLVLHKQNKLNLTFFRYRPSLIPIPFLSLYFPSTKEQQVSLSLYTGHKKTIEFLFIPRQRGLFETLPLTMKQFDLLNFFSRTTHHQLKGPFMVLPEYKREKALELKKQLVMHSSSFHNSLRQPTTMIRNFRMYQPGDALKMIDWKQSSKNGELIIKEYENDSENTLHFLFYGVAHEQFEAILAIYYSFTRLLYTQLTFSETILADKQKKSDRDSFFATLRPINSKQLLPKFIGETLLIFAPELTESLAEQLQQLAKKNDVSLITYKEKQLFLYSKNQVILISEEGNEHAK